jgi:glycosyltransferase involved in cell wall biosynthesis
MVFTAVANDPSTAPLPHTAFAQLVVEHEGDIDAWVRAGVTPDRIAVVRPGIDLDRFRFVPPPAGPRFTLLFASTPADAAEFHGRGIDCLVDLARARPDVDILVPWRAWGDLGQARRQIADLCPPDNFRVEYGDVDIRECFARAHATIACFAPLSGKSVPNFVLEGLACSRPYLLTRDAALQAAGHPAGRVVERNIAALSAAVDEIRARYTSFAGAARLLAEGRYSQSAFVEAYERIYEAASSQAPPRARIDRPGRVGGRP